MKEVNAVNNKVKKFLFDLADEGTFSINKQKPHKKIVATYGGEKRTFILANTPRTYFYPQMMSDRVNRFVSSLNIENKPKFNTTNNYK
tara:strand:- start:1355 stop:1618 length:264 start_codon:yes stop_codon:yes gene_type:complete